LDGTLYIGSLTTGAVYKLSPGETQASVFLPGGGDVKGIAGLLVDDTSNALLICAVDATFQTVATVQRYDLATGAHLATFSFPGATTMDGGANPYAGFPNDLAFDGTRRLYVSDSFGGKIYRVVDVSSDALMEEWAAVPALAPANANAFGADGITFDGASNFYVNNNNTGALVRVPLNSNGTAGTPVVITVTPALSNPDGQRQLNANTLLVVDNAGSLVTVTLTGDTGAATTISNRLDSPTGVVKVDNTYWVTEGQITTSLLTGQPPRLPFLVQPIAAY